MDLYTRIARWKISLGLAGLAIVLISMFYTNYLAQRLAEGERDKVELFSKAMSQLSDVQDLEADVSFPLEVVEKLKYIPVILVDERDRVTGGLNFGPEKDNDLEFLEEELQKIQNRGQDPIQGEGYGSSGYAAKIYFKNTRLFTLLTYFPLLQVLLLSVFVLIGFLGFSSAKRAEQNRVWAGMAKETAHQLGTPISAIMAWIEHLKSGGRKDPEQMEIIGELEKDVTRLELIADRFSKIGSAPKMESINIFKELEKCRKYMQRRAPRKVQFDFPDPNGKEISVQINPPLFDWVVENLLRNALDAMDGTGCISAEVQRDNGYVTLDISDTGKGIPGSKLKTVFQPGYTTKKRGWGLGLSLAKRIIENYHKGKIFVKQSKVGEGTTFSIKLPA